jgi:hypothetical protein
MPSTLRRALLTRDVAGEMFDEYFDMVEQILNQQINRQRLLGMLKSFQTNN